MPPSPSTNLPAEAGPVLVGIARAAITAALAGDPAPALPADPWLTAQGASFVTLTLAGGLRGCMGTIEPRRPLAGDVAANACNAAFEDRRFKPLTSREWPGVHVEVSVLSPMVPLPAADEADAVRQLRPGVDGVLLQYPGHRATFLPQVWDMVQGPVDFLARLRNKAGLDARFWHPDLHLSRYTVDSFEEGSPS